MPLLKINAKTDTPVLDGPADLDETLTEALARLAPDAPVVILLHGFKFSPYRPQNDPHSHILSLTPREGCWKAVSWPRHLGFERGKADEGLCIAFGWPARGSIWAAWDQAAVAGQALAALIRAIRARRQGAVDVVAHSLGARVTLAAMSELPAGAIGRAVLMAAAEFRGTARAAMDTPAGRTAEVFNITTRENDVFDTMMEWLVRAPTPGDRALGAGLGRGVRGWLDVQIDCAETRAALAGFGFRIPAPSSRVCHWSAYLRPGVFRFYTALIRRRRELPLACLAQALPEETSPRCSRLLRLPQVSLPMPGRPTRSA